MTLRRNNFDVSNLVDTTDHVSVNQEVARIFRDLFPDADTDHLDSCYCDVSRLYRGENPHYRACDTAYHNLQHVLEVSLAMARLMDGYERSRRDAEPMSPRLFAFGVVTALLHDVGYLRHINDSRHDNGAQYTAIHVSRGGKFIQRYLSDIGMPEFAPIAREIVHFTGYERSANQIQLPNLMFRMLGHMLGTADIIAQMADRCYLEKCRDRLFPEFVQGGLASSDAGDHRRGILFTSVDDLICKTPRFYTTAAARMDELLGGAHKYVQWHFDGSNPYFEEMDKNVRYASKVAEEQDLSLLRRELPASGRDDGK
jgi:hypothetical protein